MGEGFGYEDCPPMSAELPGIEGSGIRTASFVLTLCPFERRPKQTRLPFSCEEMRFWELTRSLGFSPPLAMPGSRPRATFFQKLPRDSHVHSCISQAWELIEARFLGAWHHLLPEGSLSGLCSFLWSVCN